MMPAVPVPVIADAARAVVGHDDAAAAIGIIIGIRVIRPVVIGSVEVPMVVVVREPVAAEVMSAKAATVADMGAAEATTLERRGGSEAAAAKMHATSTVTAAAEMHAASAVATAAKMHAAATVATAAKVTAAATTMTTATTTVHLRGQAFRDLLGHIRSARIDQGHGLRGLVGGGRHHEERSGREPKMDQATPRIEKSDHA
jgi:hypothetical protein